MDDPSVDRDLRGLALSYPRARVETPDDLDPLSVPDIPALVADVLLELADLLGEGGLRVHGEVDHVLCPERLAEDDLALEPPVGRRVRVDGCILEVLRPDAEHDLLPFEGLQRGPPLERILAEVHGLAPHLDAQAAVRALHLCLEEVHRRAPD